VGEEVGGADGELVDEGGAREGVPVEDAQEGDIRWRGEQFRKR
jgi:hypothetical protein